jgi:hypothetical protein
LTKMDWATVAGLTSPESVNDPELEEPDPVEDEPDPEEVEPEPEEDEPEPEEEEPEPDEVEPEPEEVEPEPEEEEPEPEEDEPEPDEDEPEPDEPEPPRWCAERWAYAEAEERGTVAMRDSAIRPRGRRDGDEEAERRVGRSEKISELNKGILLSIWGARG